MRLCNIHAHLIHGYIDLERHEALRRKCGSVNNITITNSITILNWPSKSPDLNPIENSWGLLVRMVYANGKQFNNRDDIKAEIIKQ